MRVSYTLSKYIFLDLLRIFLMASGALAGIMSFGGLLRPLMQQGLDAGQVGQLLTYFTPAMTAYSFPIAALFATTMVYGRLSADNELTACRAAGINLLSVALPAIAMGSLVMVVSLVFLSFIVPASTLKAERVIYSNIAKVIAGQIQRSHQITFPGKWYSLYAAEAYLPPADTLMPGEQQVVLVAPTIVKFDRPLGREDWQYRVPSQFWTAGSATVYISQTDETMNPQLTVALADGTTFPRSFEGAFTGAIGATQVGPISIPSPIQENSKLMDLRHLRHIYYDPGQSRKLRERTAEFLRYDQEHQYLRLVRDALNGARRYSFATTAGEEFQLTIGEGVTGSEKPGAVVFAAATTDSASRRRIRVQRTVSGKVQSVTFGRQAVLRASVRQATGQVDVSLQLIDSVAQGDVSIAPGDGQSPAEARTSPAGGRAVLPLAFKVLMPSSIKALEDRPFEYYISPAAAVSGNQVQLKHELIKVSNAVISEMHARAAFATSCLILVMVGCALGMMFRSGNFLTAFAISFIPAMLAITLVVAGQQISGNINPQRGPDWVNPITQGVILMWSGNLINLGIAIILLRKLARI